MAIVRRVVVCLWFDSQAEEAANYYVSIFKRAKLNGVYRYPVAGNEIHGKAVGSVMTVDFELDGVPITALNGGPVFTFNEAVSLQVMCDTLEEIDYYWDNLSQGGDPKAQVCGWLKDKFGLSWQIIPAVMPELIKDHASPAAQRTMAAMLKMKKMDIAELQRAHAG